MHLASHYIAAHRLSQRKMRTGNRLAQAVLNQFGPSPSVVSHTHMRTRSTGSASRSILVVTAPKTKFFPTSSGQSRDFPIARPDLRRSVRSRQLMVPPLFPSTIHPPSPQARMGGRSSRRVSKQSCPQFAAPRFSGFLCLTPGPEISPVRCTARQTLDRHATNMPRVSQGK